eukprot:scaffold34603_cov212-Amphora_coffeaeformis.AAC.8
MLVMYDASPWTYFPLYWNWSCTRRELVGWRIMIRFMSDGRSDPSNSEADVPSSKEDIAQIKRTITMATDRTTKSSAEGIKVADLPVFLTQWWTTLLVHVHKVPRLLFILEAVDQWSVDAMANN